MGRETAKVRMRAWLSSSRVEAVSLNVDIAEMSGELSSERDIPLADAIIASTAREPGGALATDDEHFRRLGVGMVWYK